MSLQGKVVYRPHSHIRGLQRNFYEYTQSSIIEKNKNAKILVMLHLFYDESWPEIKQYLLNLRQYHVDIVVTVTKGMIAEKTISDICAFKADSVKLIRVDNKGFDIGPFFEACTQVKNDYDVVFKLHSKGTKRVIQYIYKQLFFRRSWFLNLYEGILSAKNIHKVIDTLKNDSSFDIAAAKNLVIQDPKEKEARHLKTAAELGVRLDSGYVYVAGTCFAMNGAYFGRIKKIGYRIDDFAQTDARQMWDLAHFLERYICNVGTTSERYYYTNALTLRRTLCKPLGVVLEHILPSVKKVIANHR